MAKRPLFTGLLALTCTIAIVIAPHVVTGVAATDSEGSVASRHKRIVTTTTTTTGSAVCPSSPMCSRRGAPGTFRLRYCNPLTSRLFSLFSGARAAATPPSLSTAYSAAAKRQGPARCELPYDEDAVLRAHVLREAEQLLSGRLVGQGHIITPLMEALRRKLQYPSEPLVLHFAGDNGVGKTYTARLLSLALSLRCAEERELCDAGDSLLTISGTSFDGLSIAAARRVIVGRILQHMYAHPHGIVLIDDFTAMDPGLVPVLAPLLGRATHYPEQFLDRQDPGGDDTGVSREGTKAAAASPRRRHTHAHGPHYDTPSPPSSLGELLVIVTTDLGQQGRTVGRSAAQIEQMVRDAFAELYGTLLPSYTRTFTFLPFTTEVAAGVVRTAVANLPCTIGEQAVVRGVAAGGGRGGLPFFSSVLSSHNGRVSVVASSIDELAVLFLVERHRPAWEGKENGHALRRAVEDELVAQVLAYQLERGLDHRIIARFMLDKAKMAVVLDVRDSNGKFLEDAVDSESGHDL